MRLKKKLLRRIYMQYGGIPERFAICYDIYSSYFHDIFCGIANIVISSKAVEVWSDITITLLYKVTKWKKITVPLMWILKISKKEMLFWNSIEIIKNQTRTITNLQLLLHVNESLGRIYLEA